VAIAPNQGLLILNFSHPLTTEHLAQLEVLTGQAVAQVVDVPVQVDHNRPLVDQMDLVANQTSLSPVEWQTLPLLVNLPGYAPAAATLLAELHGRMGHFPTIVRLRPVDKSVPTHYAVAEVIDLQSIRDATRQQRF
jgi:hypothetical protein